MSTPARRYPYVGPPELRAAAGPHTAARVLRDTADLDVWLSGRGAAESGEPFTFVVAPDGLLRLAPRRSEHVACAGGGEVLAAGEMGFDRAFGRWTVREVTNQSTGYCPDLGSWHAVARALDGLGVEHPGGFTHEVVFRRCERCHECSVVREGDFVCVFCGSDLPSAWNIAS
ncbi:hypothetical protein [Streptomyces resistomycificus]|uniref:Uncharacterized protein n=1 Tax=Streptomyces resistomycificus TaxID=67356 RepID=A0A0L8KT20_9ACTN|nr:hypothetical protein [Streptomyces resistomycificus]KOG29047.1 hypothetical protein ADK37_38150 [Streptomyces resistomycificus]KUO00824.1 hypothetical protein AQJ84_07495 [Streptomyces resistomycificus]